MAFPPPPTNCGGFFFAETSSVTGDGQGLDFSKAYVAQVCFTEPGNSALLMDTLDGRIEDMRDSGI